jgi:hypothetical protein
MDHRKNTRARGRRRALLRLALVLMVGAAGVVVPPGAATADPYAQTTHSSGDTNVGPLNDGYDVDICAEGDGWDSGWALVVLYELIALDGQTDYSISGAANGCEDTTDIRFRLNNSLAGLRGQSWCNRWASETECDSAIVELNPSNLADAQQAAKTTCHEVGHTLGLSHGWDTSTFWNDCMVSGAVPDGAQWTGYSQHHIDHVNSRSPSSS